MTTLLAGIVGSTAYGLAVPGSDVDRIGIFAAPTLDLVGLRPIKETRVTIAPDSTMHEARKACVLMLGANPTLTEILWLPDDLYEERHPLGDELIGIRAAFLAAGRVRDAYLGYATQQFRKLESRGDGSFSADTRRRVAKHARHLARLITQGRELYLTGTVTIRLADPQWYLDFGQRVADGDIDVARDYLAAAERGFDERPSALPAEPDESAVAAWLLRVRRAFFDLPPTPDQRG